MKNPDQNKAAGGQSAESDEPQTSESTEADTSQASGADEREPASEEAAPQKRKPVFRRPLFWVFVAVVIVGVVAGVFYYETRVAPFATTDDAFIGADIVQIAPQVSGKILTAPVVANAHVNADDTLARIDPATVKAQLATQQAKLVQAKADLSQAKVGVEQARAQENEAEAQVSALEIKAENAEDTLSRDQNLSESASSAITDKQLDDARFAARTADANVEGARRAVATAKAGVDAAQAKVTSAEAAVKAAQSQIALSRISLDHTTVTAPLDGHVVQKSINVGSFATEGEPMMALVPDDLYVTANYKETQLAAIRAGQPVDIHVDAFPGVAFHGKVVSIQRGAGQAFQLLPPQNATGNFVKVVQRVPVRISIETPDPADYAIGPGMSVVPSIRID